MGLLSEDAVTKWNSSNKKYYESKGYTYTTIGDEVNIKINDLKTHSRASIFAKCDHCNKDLVMRFCDFNRYVKDNGKIYCKPCALKLYGVENARKTRLKNSKTFEQWCVENNRQDILERWDYELNELTPADITYGTKIKYYFKCPVSKHKSELKRINTFTSGYEGSMYCNQCSSLGQFLIDKYGDDAINMYWSDKNTINPYEIGYASRTRVWLICQNCNTEKLISCDKFSYYGLLCNECSDGISYPEKFISSLLNQLNVEHSSQLSNKTFSWCGKYRYDKYLRDINIIVEIHGIQHYENSTRGNGLKFEQENDKTKKQLAYNNGFNDKTYIIIDARYSELEYIKNSVMNSDLPQLLNFKEDDINWYKCEEDSLNSYVKIACDLWNEFHNIDAIVNIIKLSKPTIRRYLKKGSKIGLCDYDGEIEAKKKLIRSKIKVYCVELEKMFLSVTEAAKLLNLHRGSISYCCKGKQKTTGGYHWLYYDDYLKELENDNSFFVAQNQENNDFYK